jgi:4-diphosphocytidyl-2-C-methyl-D-erythritol kinase
MNLKGKSKLSLRAPAKVNLRLRITGRRPDGYHLLDMVMVKLALADEIEMELGGEEIVISCNHPQVPLDSSSTLWKAAELVRRESGKKFGVKLYLQKNAPVAAGLGAGSSDGAAVLLGLNQLLELGWKEDKLLKIGEKIGADVPFFLSSGPKRVQGIGEILSPTEVPPLFLILINPGFPVSTKEAYGWFDQLTAPIHDATFPPLENDLEKVVLPRYPVLARLKVLLQEAGALGTLMSGSGPTVFGLFESSSSRDRGYETLLKKTEPGWWVCKTENRD